MRCPDCGGVMRKMLHRHDPELEPNEYVVEEARYCEDCGKVVSNRD